jgi:ribosomal protein S18 acetylase RimI-like enzyme
MKKPLKDKGLIITRKANKKDAPAIAKMTKKLAKFHGDKCDVTTKEIICFCYGKSRRYGAIMASLDGKDVGFIFWNDGFDFIYNTKTRRVEMFFVEASYRKRGIGTILFSDMAEDALKTGVGKITVGARKDNIISNKFYKSIGLSKRAQMTNTYLIAGTDIKKLCSLDDKQ